MTQPEIHKRIDEVTVELRNLSIKIPGEVMVWLAIGLNEHDFMRYVSLHREKSDLMMMLGGYRKQYKPNTNTNGTKHESSRRAED